MDDGGNKVNFPVDNLDHDLGNTVLKKKVLHLRSGP